MAVNSTGSQKLLRWHLPCAESVSAHIPQPSKTSNILKAWTYFPYSLPLWVTSFPPICIDKTSHFGMTAQALLGSQLSHRYLWFISGLLFSRSLNSPSTLDSFILTLTMVKNMLTEAFPGMWVKKFIFLGSQSNCLLVTDKEVCTCVYCWICHCRQEFGCAISHQLSWNTRLKPKEPQQKTLTFLLRNMLWSPFSSERFEFNVNQHMEQQCSINNKHLRPLHRNCGKTENVSESHQKSNKELWVQQNGYGSVQHSGVLQQVWA